MTLFSEGYQSAYVGYSAYAKIHWIYFHESFPNFDISRLYTSLRKDVKLSKKGQSGI
jgi:hypothetical protein